jgi:hypothetical protein
MAESKRWDLLVEGVGVGLSVLDPVEVWRSTSVKVAPLLAWLQNRWSTARTSERQLVSSGNRPITSVRRADLSE